MFVYEIFNLLFTHLSLWALVTVLLALFISSCITQKLTNKGPMLWPVMGILPSIFFHVDDIYDWGTSSLIKARGTFHFRGMWMGNAHGIITSNHSNIEYMLKKRFNNFPKGHYLKDRFQDLLGDGIFNVDGKLWKEQRKLAISEMHASLFVKHSFLSMKYLVHEKLLRLIEEVVIKRVSVDFQEVLLRFTFDNICTAAFGVDPDCLKIDFDFPKVAFAKAFEEATELSLLKFLLPPFVWKPMKFLGLGYEKRLKRAIQVVHEFAEKTVSDRRNEVKDQLGTKLDHSYHDDLLSRLIMGRKNIQYSDKFLRDFCINLVLAGRDTSSVALAWFFWLLSQNPFVETKILREIKRILGQRKVSEVVFSEEELEKMVYLKAALTESMRLYPPVPIEFKEVVEDDVFPDGNVVKKGDRVLYSIYSMGRIESIWGKDCLEFKPQRWIKDGVFASDISNSNNQFKYVVFNAGPRLCLGKKFAYLQMKMVAASILLRYEVQVIHHEGHNGVVPKLNTTLYMKNGLKVIFKPRIGGQCLN